MSDKMRVVVAPDCIVEVSPHPSGIAELAPLLLHGGNTLDVTPEKATQLLAARLILDPATGEPVPPPPPPPPRAPHVSSGVTVMVGGHTYDGNDPMAMMAASRIERKLMEEEANKPKPGVKVPPWDCSNGGRTLGDYNARSGGPQIITGFAPITDGDGKPWPGF